MEEASKLKYQPSLLTIREVVRLLHVRPNTARRWSDADKLRAYRVGNRRDRRFREQEVLRLRSQGM